MSNGCNSCIPYALDFQTINGKSYCKGCGRLITDDLELYIIGSPHLRSAPRRPNNSFEKGVRRDERGVPYLDSSGHPIHMGESFDPRKYREAPVEIP